MTVTIIVTLADGRTQQTTLLDRTQKQTNSIVRFCDDYLHSLNNPEQWESCKIVVEDDKSKEVSCWHCGQTFKQSELTASGTIPAHSDLWKTCAGSYKMGVEKS